MAEKERVYDKINYQTNFTSTSTFAILLKAIDEVGNVDSDYARKTLFPQARSTAGMRYNPNNRDTHGEITLAQYGLIDYVDEKTFKLSSLGRRFLELFNDDYTPKKNNDFNYVSVMVDSVFSWVDNNYGRNINVGVLLFELLLDARLNGFITANEWSYVAEFSSIRKNEEFEKIISDILAYRESNTEFPLKKADVLLDGFSGTWKLLQKSGAGANAKYSLTDISKKIILEKLGQIRKLVGFQRRVVIKLSEIDNDTLFKIKNPETKLADDEYAEILKKLIAKCGSEWDGVRLFGAIYHNVIDGSKYDTIRTIANLKDSTKAEFQKGKNMGPFVVYKDLISVADAGEATNDLKEVKKVILERYAARTDLSWEKEEEKYNKFKSLYSKEVISSLNGVELLNRLFAPKDIDETSLIYNLEHNSFYGEFGGIGGGSQFKYPLYFYSKKQKWCTGPSLKSQTELTEEEAIEKAEEIRTKFVALFDLVESTDLTHVENYSLIQNLLNSDSLYRKIWVFKYLHMLYPDKFSIFYSWEWLIKVTKFLGLQEGSSLKMNGEISSFASEISIPNVFLAQIIFELLPSVDDDNIDETDDENESEEEEETMIIELPERSPRTYNKYPLNLVLYGAPGTGKTYSTMELACSIIDRGSASIDDICEGNTHSNRTEVMEHYNSLVKQGFITFTTFHQSYGYEDFIQGLRPDDKSESLKFVPVDGVFKKIVNKAIKDQTNNYVIIIDEINRANISKVLGELITLLETDKRWGEINQLSTKLPSGQPFAVPNNLYVIGTMNSADKSISLIDAALRRRFEFVEVSVNYKTITNSTARSVLKKINEKLEGQLDSSDLLVGHAYFIGKDENSICDVLNHNVIPLLYEYFFDSKAKVKDILKYALDGLNYEIKDEAGKRLRVVKKAE